MGEEAPRVVVSALVTTGRAVMLVGEPNSPREVPRVELVYGETIQDAARRALRASGIETSAEGRIAEIRNEVEAGRHTLSLLVSFRDEAATPESLAHPLDALPSCTPQTSRAIECLKSGFSIVDADGESLGVSPPETKPLPPKPAVTPPPTPPLPARSLGRRFVDLLGAGALLGGAYLWLAGLLDMMREDHLLSSDKKAFFLTGALAFLISTILAVRFGFPTPSTSTKQSVLRGLGSMVIAGMVFFFVIAVAEGMHIHSGNESETFVYVGALAVVLLRWGTGRARVKEPLPRFAVSCVWATVAFVTLWTVSPKLRHAMSHRETPRAED